MSRHLCFYNNDTLLQDNSEPGYFTEFTVPVDTNLIVCYDDDYKITCNIRVTASSNQDLINYQFATDSAVFLLKSLQNYTQNQTVRAQITVSNIAKDSNNIAQDIQNYLQSCGVGSGSSIDLSGVIAAINSIAASLSSLSSLAHLADLANIITAINNKDNQSELVKCFTYRVSKTDRRSVFTGYELNSSPNSSNDTQYLSLQAKLTGIMNLLSSSQISVNGSVTSISNDSKLLYKLQTILNNIETKLEQNLPFTTLAQVDVVTDYTQVVKSVGKSG